MTRKAWNKGLHVDLSSGKGQFKKGHIPWNKGLHKDLSHGKGQFRKGNRPPQYRPVGSIRHQKDGYTYIKVADPNKWVLYHRFLYEKEHHCHLKRGQLVIFLDGDRSNFDLSNLMIVTRKEAVIINHERLQIKGDKELSKSGVLVAKLKLKIKEKSNEGARK